MLTASVILKWNHNYQVPSRKTDASMPRCRTISKYVAAIIVPLSKFSALPRVTVLLHEIRCHVSGLTVWKRILMLTISKQWTLVKMTKAWPIYLKKPECYSVPKVRSLFCVLFWQSSSLICLLTEILISWYLDLPEWDFSHRGVVHGSYLNDKGRISSRCHPAQIVREKCAIRHVCCNTCQTSANIATAENKQNEKKLRK